jgi:hypothetical protein
MGDRHEHRDTQQADGAADGARSPDPVVLGDETDQQ